MCRDELRNLLLLFNLISALPNEARISRCRSWDTAGKVQKPRKCRSPKCKSFFSKNISLVFCTHDQSDRPVQINRRMYRPASQLPHCIGGFCEQYYWRQVDRAHIVGLFERKDCASAIFGCTAPDISLPNIRPHEAIAEWRFIGVKL